MGEDDAAGAEGGADDAGGDDAVADRAGGLIAGAADDGSAGREAQFLGRGGGERAGDFRRFVQPGHQRLVDLQQFEQRDPTSAD